MSEETSRSSTQSVTGVTVKLHPPNSDYSTEVLMAIADALNTNATELPPLRDSVDPDTINNILQDADARRADQTEQLSFEYADMEVTIYSDKRLHLKPLEEPTNTS